MKCLYVAAVSLLVAFIGHVCCRNPDNQIEIALEYEVEHCAYKAKRGDKVQIHYTGRLESNIVFDSSRAQGRKPIEFTLGVGQVIQGWDVGLDGMCLGEIRKLTIPPEMAYGKSGHPPVIPENAWLYFETEMMDITPGASSNELDMSSVFDAAQFLIVPLLFLGILYKVYRKYQEETGTNKPTKAQKHANRRNKRS